MQARTAAGMSRGDLARFADLAESTLSRWETGIASPQVDGLSKVVKALDLTIADVVQLPEGQRFPSDWRVLKGLTQPELGRLVGLSTTTLGRIERGEAGLTDEAAVKLSTVFAIDVDELRAAYERARRRPPGTPA